MKIYPHPKNGIIYVLLGIELNGIVMLRTIEVKRKFLVVMRQDRTVVYPIVASPRRCFIALSISGFM